MTVDEAFKCRERIHRLGIWSYHERHTDHIILPKTIGELRMAQRAGYHPFTKGYFGRFVER
jgi:hypothetical protein